MKSEIDHDRLIHFLGRAGLIPFVLLALLVWLVTGEVQAFAATAMAVYAALIVSFLGGIHWGAVWVHSAAGGPHRDEHQVSALWWGISASLLAWPGALMPAHAGLAWLGLLLAASYLIDRRFYPDLGLQPWLAMRFHLSSAASLSCFVAAGAL